MESLALPLKLLISLVLGAVIGVEREKNEKQNINGGISIPFLGLRTFSLIGLLGCVSGIIYTKEPFVALLIGIAFILLFLSFYVINSIFTKDIGITTEIAIIYTFLIGFLIAVPIFPMTIIIAVTVMLILILSRKEQIRSAVSGIKTYEMNAFVSFAIIALVILPFLPNDSYTFRDIGMLETLFKNFNIPFEKIANAEIINPFTLWLIVALITGVDVVGYVLEKTIGQKRGWLMTSVIGGFISSTATTQSIAAESREVHTVNYLLAAALFANLASFIPVAILVGSINPVYLGVLLPAFGIIMLVTGSLGFFFLKRKESRKKEKLASPEKKFQQKEIFNIVPALKFAGIFLVIRIVSKVALELFGNSGFLVASGIGALTGIDAVMINAAELSGKSIDYTLGLWAFLIINSVNLIAKVVYSSLQGSREFAVKFGICMMIIILTSLVSVLFV
jgi:uncharacterized membrane protein (DUF4010 family)